jgi:hypothetical protein
MAVAAVAAFCGLEIRDGERNIKLDPPCAAVPKSGGIAGKISAGKYVLASVEACCRETGKKHQPEFWDKTTGQFEFRNLPGDTIYDMRITTADGSVFEGADMSMPDRRLTELAEMRKKILGVPLPQPRDFTKADADEINKLVTGTKGFADISRTMIIKGHGRRAAALVELIRTGKVVELKPGQIIWRVDLWYFEHTGDAWRRMDNQERTLERVVTTSEKLAAVTFAFDPDMCVKIDADGISTPATLTLPDAPDPACSRPAGAELQINSNPIIME